MKALAVDCATACFAVAARNGTDEVKLAFRGEVGGKNKLSAKLLPAMDYVMREAGLSPVELEAVAVTIGPGSFTGLRVGLSALKALTLAHGTPVYAVPTLDALAYPYRSAAEIVLPVIESHCDEFFHAIFMRGKKVSSEDDLPVEGILAKLDAEADVLVCGQGAPRFAELCTLHSPLRHVRYFSPECYVTGSLFALAERMIAQGERPLEDTAAPFYVRKSEAEVVRAKASRNSTAH